MENNQSLLNAVLGVMSSNKAIAEASEKLLKEKYGVVHENLLTNEQRVAYKADVAALTEGPKDLTEEKTPADKGKIAAGFKGATPGEQGEIAASKEKEVKEETVEEAPENYKAQKNAMGAAPKEAARRAARPKHWASVRDGKTGELLIKKKKIEYDDDKLSEMKEYGVDGERERASKGERYDRAGKIVNKMKSRKAKSGGTETGKKADEVEVKEENIQELSRATLKSYLKKNNQKARNASDKKNFEGPDSLPVGSKERNAAAKKAQHRREGSQKAYQRLGGEMTVKPQKKEYSGK